MIGVLLLTTVIVLVVGLVGALLLSGVDTDRKPAVQLDVAVQNTTYTLSHLGGDAVGTPNIAVVLSGGDSSRSQLSTLTELQGDGDDSYEGGEVREGSHNAGDVLTIIVIHEPSNTVLIRESLDVPVRDVTGLTWDTAADWDAASSARGVVHSGFGDHTADRVELGYPRGEALAYWPLDENSGSTATDVAGNNDGAIEGTTLGVGGVFGTTSYAFDGSDDYVSGATDIDSLRNTASISLWVNTTATGDATMWQAPGITGVESAGDGDDIFWGWLDDTGRIGVQAGDQPAAMSNDPINDGTWHHVVLTRNATTGRVEVYVDGSFSDAATSRTGQITNSFDSIGRIEDTGGTPEYFPGRIEAMQVYDRVVEAGTVTALYETASRGNLTTDGKRFSKPVNVSNLRLEDVSSTRPTEVNVTIESDPDGDGAYEESSGTISLEGSGTYGVSGLSTESKRFRLVLEFDSPAVTTSPSFDSVTLRVAG